MNTSDEKGGIGRRDFFKIVAAAGAGAVISGPVFAKINSIPSLEGKPKTNIADALKYPRTAASMPGKYPGKVVQIEHAKCIAERRIDPPAAYDMVAEGMRTLTGESDLGKAWLQFFNTSENIGIKVNPIAGAQLSTSIEITQAVIKQLTDAGIPKEHLIIWDRRSADLKDSGFDEKNFPGIAVMATEIKDEKGSYFDKDGRQYGEAMIDKDWYYRADTEEKYDAETLPYMINEGKDSYFTKIVTQTVDKIINIPVMKNAGSSVTLAMKNLAYGSITNTSRLHKQLWGDTCAEVCAFPPLRDKVALNIVDGIRGCYQGGPAANPQFITEFKTVLFSTDPVAVDRIGYEIILKKRIEEKIQKTDTEKGKEFMVTATKLGLGISDIGKIELIKKKI